jgi:hypothetical protein
MVQSALTGHAIATFHIESLAKVHHFPELTDNFFSPFHFQGTFNTEPLALFKSGLPGLTIPGIITLGPIFSISTLSTMTEVEFATAVTMTTNANFPNLQFTFPQTKTPESVLPQVDPNCM